MKRAIFFCGDPKSVRRVYDDESINKIRTVYEIEDRVYTRADLQQENFANVEAIFSTWGMHVLTEEDIAACFPSLRYLFYAAGTVQHFAKPFLNRGVRVFSAWKANAVPVAEFTVAQILLANKGYYQSTRKCSDYAAATAFFQKYVGNYGAKIGILGDGAIGSLVINELLRYKLEVCVFSITMTEAEAQKKGVRLCSLSEIFAECDVISNHLANNEATKKIINRSLLESMKPNATFINTGRGAQVDEDALADVLAKNPDITALLDVTDPEPPVEGSPLYTLNNVFLTPHIAGSAGKEVNRMADFMANTCRDVCSGLPSDNEVTMRMLEVMA